MTTFYLDPENGNDAADGLSFANRWKTFNTGATAARTAPGDEIRVIASPDPTLVGNATWTKNSKTVTLAAAVTQMISDCEAAWTASANVTYAANATTYKEGTKSASLAIAAGFATGKVAYVATGALNLSAYQQVSFWINPSAAIAVNTLRLQLCSDLTGDTPVNTIAIPACPMANGWQVVTVDTGGALGAAIQSIALNALADPGAVTVLLDNIIACKASASADSLTLSSYIGKEDNLSWVAGTPYALNAQRRPTQPNRNGFLYRATTAGNSHAATEPTWPTEVGETVADGTVVWECVGLEDTWFAIQSINGTTVMVGDLQASTAAQGRGYSGATATVATYKREAMHLPVLTTSSSVTNTPHSAQEAGTQDNYIRYTGGWDRTGMTTQNGESWFDSPNGRTTGWYSTVNYVEFNNLNTGRSLFGIYTTGLANILRNCHVSGANTPITTTAAFSQLRGVYGANGSASGGCVEMLGYDSVAYQISACGNSGGEGLGTGGANIRVQNLEALNNSVYGVQNSADGLKLVRPHMADNVTSSLWSIGYEATLIDALMEDATEISAQASNKYVYSHNHDRTAGNHLITAEGGTIRSATDFRHTETGLSWKFNPTSTNRGVVAPLVLKVAKLKCTLNIPVTVRLWARRDHLNIKGKLLLRGGQLAGVPSDVSVAVEPAVGAWVQSDPLTFTPTESGVVELEFHCWDGVGIVNSLWIDDFSVA